MALTYEQFKKAKESGLSTEQIVQFEKRRTKESQVGQKIQTQTEQPSGVLSNVLGATKAVGGFLGGLAKDITKPVASSIVSPIQLAKTAKNYYGDEDVQKRRFEAMRGIDPDKQAKHTDDLYKALKTAETEEEKASIIKLMQEDLNKYVKGIQEKPIKEEVDTSVTLPLYGKIESPKTAKEVAGRAIETVALGAGGTAKVGATAGKSLFKRALTGPGSKIGTAYGAGSALSENKSLGETAIQAGIGGILGGATDLALIGGGKGLQKLGEKLQKPTAETKLSLGEKAASSIINSLIKPLKKDFAYGKNPGLSVAREKITANSWDDLVTKIGKARTKTGKEIGSFYKDNVDGKTTVNLSNSLKSIDETIKKAASENNQSVINRLEDVKNAITKKLVPAKDEAGKTIIKTAGKKRLYNIKPSNAQSIIEKIGGMTKFTGNVSDDNMVNKALKKVYGSARNELESSIKKVDEGLYSKIRQLNEHYGNITSADIAAKNREMIVQRANLMGLAPEVISGTSIVGGLASGNPIAIIGGIMTAMGNQAMKSPAIKTRLASMLAGASNKERISIFAKYPALKSLKENIGAGISKTGEFIEKIPGIAEEAPRKSVQSLMEAARTKMPIGMTIKDVSKEGFKEAEVPEKLIQEAKKYKSAEDFIKAQGTPVYHSSSEKFANGKPNFDAYFGDADWKKEFAKEFGVNEYEVVLPKNKKILDLNKNTPEANAFIEKWGGSREDFYDEDWVDKYKVFPEVKKSGYDGAKFQGEYILSKDLINEIKTKSQLTDIWNKAKETPTIKTGKPLKEAKEELVTIYRGQDEPIFSLEPRKGKAHNMMGNSFTRSKEMAEMYSLSGKGLYPTVIEGTIPKSKIMTFDKLSPRMRERFRKEISKMEDDDIISGELIENIMDEVIPIAKHFDYEAVDMTGFTRGLVDEIRVVDSAKTFKLLSKTDRSDLLEKFKAKSKIEERWNKANQKETLYKETGSLTTKLLKKLEGKTTVNKQFISDLTNSPDLKQTEKDLIRAALKGEDSKINVTKFANKVKAELLPLKVKGSGRILYQDGKSGMNAADVFDKNPPKYENIALPDELRGKVKNYSENIYESPIKTSAGQTHFGGDAQNYFGHTRIEDMADNKTRRVIEVQSDLYQKGGLKKEQSFQNLPYEDYKKIPSSGNASEVAQKMREKQVEKLAQYNDPTAHFRMVREEIAQAAKDKKTKVQFPTGETAMKIEGLGQESRGWVLPDEPLQSMNRGYPQLDQTNLKVGLKVRNDYQDWIITDVLGDGKFKAIPKSEIDKIGSLDRLLKLRAIDGSPMPIDRMKETFDISGKVDINNPIYKFYEKDLGKYLKSKYNAKEVIDDQGVSWYEVDIKPEMKGSIEAFGIGAIPLATQINQDKK